MGRRHLACSLYVRLLHTHSKQQRALLFFSPLSQHLACLQTCWHSSCGEGQVLSTAARSGVAANTLLATGSHLALNKPCVLPAVSQAKPCVSDVSGFRCAHALPMLCRNWRTRKGRMTVASGSKAKVVDSPTDNITCPHGDLLPESAGTRARRISLPRDLWGFLRGSWQAAELKRAQEAAEAATEAATAAETAAVARQADLLKGAPADRSTGWVGPSEMQVACGAPGAVETAVLACGPLCVTALLLPRAEVQTWSSLLIWGASGTCLPDPKVHISRASPSCCKPGSLQQSRKSCGCSGQQRSPAVSSLAPACRTSAQADSDCVMVEADGALAGPGMMASSPAPPEKGALPVSHKAWPQMAAVVLEQCCGHLLQHHCSFASILVPRGRAVIAFSATPHKLKLQWLLNLANWSGTPAALLGPGSSVLCSWSVCVKPCSLVAC